MLSEADLSHYLSLDIPGPLQIQDIGWKVQETHSSQLLFYRIGDTSEAEEEFQKRISQAQYGWLIVNRYVDDLPPRVSIVPEEKWPEIQKKICDAIYPLPPMKMIAVTGTNGKTTTADLVLQMGTLTGREGISIGTLGVRDKTGTLVDFGLTTPPLIDLRKYLHHFGVGKEFCVMEVSSHALSQGRIHGLDFEAAGWTSFSQDHLDYHHTLEEYFEAKLKILEHLKPGAHLFIPASQSELYQKVHQASSRTKRAQSVEHSKLPLSFQAAFNRDNLEVAWSLFEAVLEPFPGEKFTQLCTPEGRFYIRASGTNFIVVDFAHTPDALENICQALHSSFPQHELRVLFGCGGNRDRNKRPLMGAAVGKWAQKVYLTSDNPRFEDPEQIIQDVLPGLQGKETRVIVDRKTAVTEALDGLGENTVLLLAGKGHEDYILIKGVKHSYSDIAEVESFLAGKKND